MNGVFTLPARRRVAGRDLGTMHGLRRGGSSDPTATRPYRSGDDPRLIDHRSSAKLATARGSDDLLLREHLADLSPPVALVVDPSPSMGLYPAESPWLHKPAVVRAVDRLVGESARAARSVVLPPRTSLEHAVLDGRLRRGSFVFVVSDFLEPVDPGVWLEALARGLDPVPVVVQDPVWERSFPAVAGAVLPIVFADIGGGAALRLRASEISAHRARNEERFDQLGSTFTRMGIDAVVIESHDEVAVLRAFVLWSELRRQGARVW
jgi:uncharacterized protein (DUF58 family)